MEDSKAAVLRAQPVTWVTLLVFPQCQADELLFCWDERYFEFSLTLCQILG